MGRGGNVGSVREQNVGLGLGRRSSVSRTGVTNPFPQERRALDSRFPFYLECGRLV